MSRQINSTAFCDVYQQVTNRVLEQMERAAHWEKPWRSGAGEGNKLCRPLNVGGKPYRGINVPLLWSAGYASPVWGTYKAWQGRGCQVRRGEHDHMVVFWKRYERAVSDTDGDEVDSAVVIARGYVVFNAEQVDGYTAAPREIVGDDQQRNDNAERFIVASKAAIRYGGDRAYYTAGDDHIQMPPRTAFVGSSTTGAAESFYATLLHELTHWTGHPNRCAREFGKRFGDQAYAFEELVAELGSAFLCADLAITPQARQDHANYLASWIKILRQDKRAIFTAASKAEAACSFLHQFAGTGGDGDNANAEQQRDVA